MEIEKSRSTGTVRIRRSSPRLIWPADLPPPPSRSWFPSSLLLYRRPSLRDLGKREGPSIPPPPPAFFFRAGIPRGRPGLATILPSLVPYQVSVSAGGFIGLLTLVPPPQVDEIICPYTFIQVRLFFSSIPPLAKVSSAR